MAYKNKVLPIPLTSIDSAFFTGAYQLLSDIAGVPHALISLTINNRSDVDVTISYDGITDHDFLSTLMLRQWDFQSNNAPQNYVAMLSSGTKIYIKGLAGSGEVYLSGFYIPTT